jgi:hypothetical protein
MSVVVMYMIGNCHNPDFITHRFLYNALKRGVNTNGTTMVTFTEDTFVQASLLPKYTRGW